MSFSGCHGGEDVDVGLWVVTLIGTVGRYQPFSPDCNKFTWRYNPEYQHRHYAENFTWIKFRPDSAR
jgi:hypothetical protein